MFRVDSSEVFGKIKCPFLNEGCPFGIRSCLFSHEPSTFLKHSTDSRLATPSMSYWKNLHAHMRTEQVAINSSILASDSSPSSSADSSKPAVPALNIKSFLKSAPTGCKISLSLRERMIMRLVREMRAAGRSDASIADAAALEHEILNKSGAKVTSVYLSVAADRIKSLSSQELSSGEPAPAADLLNRDRFSEAALLSLLVSRRHLEEYWYPREALNPSQASNLFCDLDAPKKCRRCGTEFIPSRQDSDPSIDCRYHPERQERLAGTRVYSCCLAGTGASGCVSASFHVHEHRNQGKRGEQVYHFCRLPSASSAQASPGFLALDVEMFYTRGGYEASRLTLVDFHSEAVVLDCLVHPRHGPVLDYNTRFSGISADMYQPGGELPVFTFDQLRERLGELIGPETVLIGHSLDNDLRVLEVRSVSA